MTISILGCGWLGLPLGGELVKEGYVVKGSTTRAEKFVELKSLGILPFRLKITDNQIDADHLESFLDADLIFINIPPGRKRSDVAEKYPQEISLLLNEIGKSRIGKIIFASSTSVYGSRGGDWVDENSLTVPETESGKALVEAERLLQDRKMDWVILRFAGLVGGKRQPGRWFAGKENLPNGNAKVNMVHRQDSIQIIKKLIASNLSNEIFNVCADKHPMKKDFYKAQAEKLGLTPPTFTHDPAQEFKLVSNAKLKEQLGYEFLYPDPMVF